MVLISTRNGRLLNLLAECWHIHGLPATDGGHAGEEFRGRLSRVHIRSYIRVDRGALLEDADAIVVLADSVVRVI